MGKMNENYLIQNNVDDQRTYLKNNLENINVVKGVIIDLKFKYDHIDMGHNAASFCLIKVEDNFVNILKN